MTADNQPEFNKIVDWLEGRLPEEEAQAIAEQLEASGADAADQADWVREFLETAELSRRTTPPRSVHRELVESFRARPRSESSAPGFLQQLAAVLTFDSSAQVALAGVRAAPSVGKQRQLIFETDAAEIALNIQPDEKGYFSLSGQIFPRSGSGAAGWSIQALAEDGSTERGLTTSDEFGEFGLANLPAGRCEIVVSGEDVEISLPEIRLQH